MTFRIDSVSKINLNGECWLFEIKGYEGRGKYMTLYTNAEGRTLRPVSAPPGQTTGVIPGTEAFFVLITATKAVAQVRWLSSCNSWVGGRWWIRLEMSWKCPSLRAGGPITDIQHVGDLNSGMRRNHTGCLMQIACNHV